MEPLSMSELKDLSDDGTESGEAASERRKSYRLNKVLGATLIGESDTVVTRLFVIDISASGFRATDHSAPKEEEYDIEIALVKGDEPFKSRTRVVWVKELTVSGMFQMGCEFIDPDSEQIEKLSSFIAAEKGKIEGPTGTVSIQNPWTMIS